MASALTTKEAAEYLQFHEETIRALARRRVIGEKIGGRWRFSKAQLDRLLEPEDTSEALTDTDTDTVACLEKTRSLRIGRSISIGKVAELDALLQQPTGEKPKRSMTG